MKKIAVIIIILISLPGIIFSQTKVGTTQGEFLLISPSIRSNGMGQVGAALVDEYSFYYNPGSLGLYYLKDEFSITPWSGTNDMGGKFTYDHQSFSIPLLLKQYSKGKSIGISGVLSSNKYRNPKMEETDYNRVPTGRTIRFENFDYNISLGFGYSGLVEIGTGFSVKKFGEKVNINDYSTSYLAYDFGGIIRIPLGKYFQLSSSEKYNLILLPSIGFSYSNIDSKIKLDGDSYPFPKTYRTGFAVTCGVNRSASFGHWEIGTLVPAIEIEKTKGIKHISKYGVELGIVEAFYLRLGSKEVENISVSTWGFTINSGGIFKTILALKSTDPDKLNKTINFLANRLTFQYSMANYNHDSSYDNDPFRGFSIKYKLSRLN